MKAVTCQIPYCALIAYSPVSYVGGAKVKPGPTSAPSIHLLEFGVP